MTATIASVGDSVATRVAPPGRDLLTPELGRVTGLIGHPGFGLTRIGLTMLARRAVAGPVVYLDARGWLCPPAAWEAGIAPERLIVVRCSDPVHWARVAATLLEGIPGLYAEVPRGVKDAQLRKLAALARSRRVPVVLRPVRGELPSGIAHLRLEARKVRWDGPDAGHGRLQKRRLVFEASGKAMRGMAQTIEVEDHGADAVRLVPRLAATSARRAAG